MKKRTKIIFISLVVVMTLVVVLMKSKRVSPLSWGHKEVNQSLFSDEAINGYDPVAYFTAGEAIPGSKDYTYIWKDASWYFSSEKNREIFIENPEIYAPQFGGYCSFAVSKGFTANSDPNSFEIINDKLYLFDSEGVKLDWMSSLEENLNISESNWK